MLEAALEQRIVLEPCSWDTYERILADHADRSAPRFTYLDGALEIMRPSPEHEELSEALKAVISIVCEECDIDLRPLGSTTQRCVEKKRGVEPDASFFVGNVGRNPLTPPDLMVEVEISRAAIDKLPIFAALGVPEVWRCGPKLVRILVLRDGQYVSSTRSSVLPVDEEMLTRWLQARNGISRNVWLRTIRSSLS